jgi:hypothetical protein
MKQSYRFEEPSLSPLNDPAHLLHNRLSICGLAKILQTDTSSLAAIKTDPEVPRARPLAKLRERAVSEGDRGQCL